MKDEKTLNPADDSREFAELLKELDADEKAQVKAVIVGMLLARGTQERAESPARSAQTA